MIAPSVQALAELSARIADQATEREINILAQTKYPANNLAPADPRSRSRLTALYFVLKIEDRIVLTMCATWEPTPAYVRGAIRAERTIRNCASPNAGCLPAPAAGQRRAIHPGALRSQERSASNMDSSWRPMAPRGPKSARWWRWRANFAVLLLSLWKNNSHYEPFPQRRRNNRGQIDPERLRCIA